MEGPIYSKTIRFSVSLIPLYKELLNNHEYIISRQLMRSGTSVGANVQEATAAQSRRDFISKMSIAAKEAKETRYWLIILSKGNLIEYDFTQQLAEIDEIIKILSKIIITAKNNLGKKISN
jgi:four helix bundle protein